MSSTCPITIKETIANGSFGYVYQVVRNDSQGYIFALKHYVGPGYNVLYPTEVDIMFRLRHTHLMSGKEIIQMKNCGSDGLAILMDLATCDLHRVQLSIQYSLDRRIVHFYQTITAYAFLHDNKILYCDSKLDNILLIGAPFNGNIVLTDYSHCQYTNDIGVGFLYPTLKNVPEFNPPEFSSGPPYRYNEKTDVYILGLAFRALFINNVIDINDQKMIAVINILNSMTNLNPNSRPSMKSILTSQLFNNIESIPISASTAVVPNYPLNIDSKVNLIVKNIIKIMYRIFPDNSLEELFLAIDLGYRSSGFNISINLITIACCAIAVDMFTGFDQSKNLIFNSILKQIFSNELNISLDDVTDSIGSIFIGNNGVLYRPYLFSYAHDVIQLKISYQQIIVNGNNEYYVVDIPQYFSIIEKSNNPADTKYISIGKFFQL